MEYPKKNAPQKKPGKRPQTVRERKKDYVL